MGAKRYEAYRNGAKFGDVAKPSATYRATLPELPQTPGNGPISPSNASETPSTANDPPQAETSPQEPKIDRSTLPDFDGSPKQNAWAADLREKELDEWEAVALSERVKKAVEPAKSKRRFFYNAEVERQKDLVRAEIEKRGEAVVLAEMEAAAREIAAEIFANPSARDWIDGRDGPSVWTRAINEARRRVAPTGNAAKPKPAFDLPPLDLPELTLPRLSGSPRQIEWAEDLRRRAVRDLTEERANETIAPRDHVQRWRQWSTRRDAKKIRDELPELEKAIAEVGGDDAAALILGRETFLKAREFVEAWDDSRDWIDLKTEQKVDLNAYAAQKIAGTPKEAAAILRRYAADVKTQAENVVDAAKAGNLGVRLDSESVARNLENLQDLRFAAGYVEQKSVEKAAKFLKREFGIVADYSGFNLTTANAMNLELIRARNIFGTCGDISAVKSDEKTLRSLGALGGFDNGKKTILLLPEKGVLSYGLDVKKLHANGFYSTNAENHVFRHEIGHALLKGLETSSVTKYNKAMNEIRKLRERETLKGTGAANLSGYGMESTHEFIAESVAEVMNGNARPLARQVVKMLFEW